MNRLQKIRLLDAAQCIQTRVQGEHPFKLRYGSWSFTFVDCKALFFRRATPYLATIVNDLEGPINPRSIDALCGIPTGGSLVADALSKQMNLPLIQIDKETGHISGPANLLHSKDPIRLHLIEDVITTGESTQKIIILLRKFFEESGLHIHGITCIASRRRLQLNALDIDAPISAWIHINPASARIEHIAHKKKTRLIAAADLISFHKLLEFANQVGPHICILKIHTMLYRGEPNVDWTKLKELAHQHEFLIMEDAKFADVGSIMKRQTDQLLQLADVITVVPGAGIGAIKNIHPELGVFLVAQYSTQGHLHNYEYVRDAIQLANQFPHQICGFICQDLRDFKDDAKHFLLAMPGVSTKPRIDSDTHQNYETIAEKKKRGGNLFIVGKELYDLSPENRIEMAKALKKSI